MGKAKDVIKKDNLQEDLVAQGFHKLDDNLISNKPPKIKWGVLYQAFSDKEKIKYLEKLCSSMNHAAYLIQTERNELLRIYDLKEEQIVKMKEALDSNTHMLQCEITKINEERQQFNKEAVLLKQKIRKLKTIEAEL